jgi:hypothetical protein
MTLYGVAMPAFPAVSGAAGMMVSTPDPVRHLESR